MKIAYFTHDMNPKAGWGRYTSDLLSGIAEAGHEIVVLKEIDDGLRGIPVLKSGFKIINAFIASLKYIKDADIIHAIDLYPCGVIAFLASLVTRKRYIITLVGTYSVAPLHSRKTRLLCEIALRHAHAVTSISRYTKKLVQDVTNTSNIEVITPGFNFDKFYSERTNAEEDYVLSVGALKYRKGYHISIPAFKIVKDRFPSLKYKIVTDSDANDYSVAIRELITKYGLGDSLEILTGLGDSELKKLYSGAKLFVLASINKAWHFEGFGIVFLEAAAAGAPVVGTIGNGIEDAVNNKNNGILVPQGNSKAMADAMISILSDKKIADRMSEESYLWAKRQDISLSRDRFLAIYNRIK